MTRYETELIAHLKRELNPRHRVGMLSMKTDPLSDECKKEIAALAGHRGFRVEFPVEDVPQRGANGVIGAAPQHFIRVFRVATA